MCVRVDERDIAMPKQKTAGPFVGRRIFLVAGAGWPSPLRGSVSLDGFIPMLPIGPSRLELLPRRFKSTALFEIKKATPLFEGAACFIW
jgi:hypothetical protein